MQQWLVFSGFYSNEVSTLDRHISLPGPAFCSDPLSAFKVLSSHLWGRRWRGRGGNWTSRVRMLSLSLSPAVQTLLAAWPQRCFPSVCHLSTLVSEAKERTLSCCCSSSWFWSSPASSSRVSFHFSGVWMSLLLTQQCRCHRFVFVSICQKNPKTFQTIKNIWSYFQTSLDFRDIPEIEEVFRKDDKGFFSVLICFNVFIEKKKKITSVQVVHWPLHLKVELLHSQQSIFKLDEAPQKLHVTSKGFKPSRSASGRFPNRLHFHVPPFLHLQFLMSS